MLIELSFSVVVIALEELFTSFVINSGKAAKNGKESNDDGRGRSESSNYGSV